MSNSMLLFFFLSFFIFISPTSSSPSSTNTTHRCSVKQALALLLFKQNLSSINDTMSEYAYGCEDWLGSGYTPILINWNTSTDCCDWNGVTCDYATGDVIGLDLSCGMVKGTIHPNTTLFHLPRLQRLNLAYNNFTHSQLPPHISKLSNSLTHLNMSSCGFTGQVPADISHLHKLVSLDLSWNGIDLNLEPHVFTSMLQNLTVMKELSLEFVIISSFIPTYINISSSLMLLNVKNTGLLGNLPNTIFNLQSLETLDLSYNSFTGRIPSEITLLPKLVSLDLSWNGDENGIYLNLEPHVFTSMLQNLTVLKELSLESVIISSFIPTYINISSSLMLLNVRNTGLHGNLPNTIFNLQSLEKLYLWNNGFTGRIPSEITLLPKLVSLDLSWNGIDNLHMQPHIFSILLENSTLLRDLWLAGVNIGFVLPTYLNISSSLRSLDLRYTGLQGKLPDNILSLEYLEELDLSGNNNLSGPLPNVNTSTNSPLTELYLSRTNISGGIPTSIGHLNSLISLDISYCGLNGSLPKSIGNLRNLEYLRLSSNTLSGTLPSSLFTLHALKSIHLDNNMFQGNINVANNQLTGQIDVLNNGHIQKTFQRLTNLTSLDLSYNDFIGEWELDTLLSSLKNLDTLILSFSGISATTDNAHHYVNPNFWTLGLASCSLKVFPAFIRSMKTLSYLDLSRNDIHGHIPDWVGNMGGRLLRLLDLSNNSITGTIPNVHNDCYNLIGFILNGNQLEGKVPTSLNKCIYLKVIDLGNNHLNDTFPSWLGDLPDLEALILRSNKFHGGITTSSMGSFPSLRVLDLSHNRFLGQLPTNYFQYFNAMKDVLKNNTKPQYLSFGMKYYSITCTMKGVDQSFPRLLVEYTIIDLSNNKFEGEIPNIIGNLNSLKVLDLSHNSLTGRIPQALGNISEIESLDLSWNQLTGEIPQSLADLTSLEFLNLSQNHLVGHIPEGKQFNTFDRNSFGGNPKLCGLPLPKKCSERPQEPQLEGDEDGDEEDSGFTWKVVMMGYGCGTLLGFVLGYLMLSTGRPKWVNAFVDDANYVILKRQIKRR